MRRIPTTSRVRIVAVALVLLISACSTVTTTRSVNLDASANWILLPIDNLSTTPLAGEKAAALIETQLRASGVRQLQTYQNDSAVSLKTLLDSQAEFTKAAVYARSNGFRYAITGTVNDWGYKTGPDKEPTVGLNLKILQFPGGEVIWQATGARTGWSYASPSSLGDKVIAKLLKKIRITHQRAGSGRAELAAAVPE